MKYTDTAGMASATQIKLGIEMMLFDCALNFSVNEVTENLKGSMTTVFNSFIQLLFILIFKFIFQRYAFHEEK